MKRLMFVFLLLFSVSIFAQKIQNQTVDAACAMCQFKVKTDKGCAMAVKIDGKVYLVEGMDKKAFGEMHSDDGYCKIMKKAVVTGEIKKGKFYATSFKYVEN
ncbi:MAG: hypothetical protein LC112_07490 [Flavobacteriales bacterium]|nr:hypothetical protein [Flavobacteriales bacterium]